MRLAIDGLGYRSAVDAFVSANRDAVAACCRLGDRLSGTAGMAGDDATAAEFAASYDDAAGECVAAVAELADALCSLAGLAEASAGNHERAEAASVIDGAMVRVVPPTSRADRCARIVPATPPSSLGGDSSTLPGWANVVLDLLEGVFWPDADTGRLREAGAAWALAASAVSILSDQCDAAAAALADEVSPEVPLAIATTDDLRARIGDLSDQLAALGAACRQQADQVDEKREEILGVLGELAIELGVGAVISAGLTFLSGGAASGAAGAAAAARLAAASSKVRESLEALGLLSRGTAATLRPVATTVRDTRAYLARLASARRAAMTERGSIDLGDGFSWLGRHERAGGHVLERHVGKSDEQLLRRLTENPDLSSASAFSDQLTAERVLSVLLRRHRDEIVTWLASSRRTRTLEDTMSFTTGRTAGLSGQVTDVSGVRALLVRDPAMPEGFRIHTAFPQP